MMRILVCLVLGLVVGAAGRLAAEDKKGPLSEKTDSKVDRSITGHVEKVDARDEHHGTLAVRATGAGPGAKDAGKDKPAPPDKPYHYTFRVDDKTRLLTAQGKDLERGLKNPLLARAEVRVVFIDHTPKAGGKGAEADKPRQHLARAIQLIQPDKPAPKK